MGGAIRECCLQEVDLHQSWKAVVLNLVAQQHQLCGF